jgi:hypothetical protein
LKSIIIDEISDIVVNYEDKLTNSYKLENLIASRIMDALLDSYPDVMLPIYESSEKIKTGINLIHDELYERYKSNIIDKNYLPIPRLEYFNTSSDKNCIEISPKEFLEYNIRSMIYPILVRNYSLVKKLEFLEYSIARINDPVFYSNISNLVYLKESLTNPFIDKLFSIGTVISGTNFLKEIAKAFKLATGKNIEKECPTSTIYLSINNLIVEVIKENSRQIRLSYHEYAERIFYTFLKHYNFKRKFNGLEKVDFDIELKDNYSYLLCNLLDEMDYLKTLKTYYSNGFEMKNDFKELNGFYCDNGSFVLIESEKDSLIENIKSRITYRKYYGINNRFLGIASQFKDYGFGYNLVEHEPFTTLICNSCYDYVNLLKDKIAALTIKEYKEKKKTLR